MAKLKLTADDEKRLLAFLKHRRLNQRCIDKLKEIKTSKELKPSDLETANTLNYSDILKNIKKAIDKGWYTLEEFVTLLDESEIAGKQHVCVFNLPDSGEQIQKVIDILRKPTGEKAAELSINDFLKLPLESTVSVLASSSTGVTIKVVTQREYWLINPLEQEAEREVWERVKQRERSSIIVKACAERKLLQIRVPPRQKTQQQETAGGVYKFATQALSGHYAIGQNSWFQKLGSFPIGSTFKKLLQNKKDFELWYDSPQNKGVRIKVGRVGRPKPGNDLRDDDDWTYSDGYARQTLRGFCICPEERVYAHLNNDSVRLDAKTTRPVARIFVPGPCSDGDLDHVIDTVRKCL